MSAQYKGFTLSEVLITLGIIGVVAALTIPTLLNSTQDKEYKAALKKADSVLSNALLLLAKDNGGELTNSFTSVSDFKNQLAQELTVMKDCNGLGLGDCWTATTKYLNKSTINWGTFMGSDPSFILHDGSSIHLDYSNGDPACKSDWNGESLVSDVCLVVMVDVNGLKKPNTMGKDIYRFFIKNSATLVPFGAPSTNAMYDPATDCKSTGTGSGCTAAYLFGN